MFSFIKEHKFSLTLLTLALLAALVGAFMYVNKMRLEESSVVEMLGTAYPQVAAPFDPCASYTIDPKENIAGDNYYKIAVYGDSMVETMGEHMDYLKAALLVKYPGKDFVLLNYGVGAENVLMGLERFDKPFDRNERKFIPVSCIKPDIIILGSFAYNPFTPHDRAKHITTLAELVHKSKKAAQRVYMLAEIAPLENKFGDGPNGVNWPEIASDEHTLKIKEQLDNAVNLAGTESLGLINAYLASQTKTGYGNPKYVNPSDGIHPSVAGHQFMATMIADTIELD